MGGGITLNLRFGESRPEPAPQFVMEAFQSLEVTHTDAGRSGFQLIFQVGRSGSLDLKDYQLIKNPLLKVFNRVIIQMMMPPTARLLMDGIITNQQLSPSFMPGQSTFTITGEDVSVMMDLEEKSVEHTAQNPQTIVERIVNDYRSPYGLVPEVQAPPNQETPHRNDRIPVQQGTDLDYVNLLAQRYAYVFYVTPGPGLNKNTAYWGPPKRRQTREIQRALSINMGYFTNLNSIRLQNNALSATKVAGRNQDRQTNRIGSVNIEQSQRPSLAARSPLAQGARSQPHTRLMQFRESGRTTAQTDARAQAVVDRSTDDVVTMTGEVDTDRYGDLLEIRKLVGLRGAGLTYDGLYYVKSVTHRIQRGDYRQSFTITREGIESTVQSLPV
ncbi:MAG: hypothetical protein F6J97_16910 [Leptolyngbya sp. SIO4C1]|nr:hypothetical protein [Leptolyngbya sp. SIO4C1]